MRSPKNPRKKYPFHNEKTFSMNSRTFYLFKTIRFFQFLLFIGLFWSNLYAQESIIPLDPRVKVGQLPNGLTYYIQENPKPANKVELRLIVKIGSVVEEDHEQGFAHFTEHMAFNGTENFPKNDLIHYLQSIGVAFGSDLNAYTGFNETVYILPLPTDDEEKMKKGFQVLRDWAGGILMDEKDIEEERNIIIEEWRTSQGYEQRLRDQYLPYLLYKSQYAKRLPIGDIELLKTFPASDLKAFYKKWYRPDLMAIVAIGDQSPEIVEAYIQEFFSSLENPIDSPKRETYTVPQHSESFVCLLTDKEAPGTQIQLFYKHPPLGTSTTADYRAFLERLIYGGILNQRLDELRKQAHAPIIYAGGSYGNFINGLDYFALSAVVSPENMKTGLAALLQENERIARFGVTKEELQRAKSSLLNNVETGFKEMDKIESRYLVNRYVNHFLQGKFAEGEAKKWELYQTLLAEIYPQHIQELGKLLIKDDNRVLILTASDIEKDKLPQESELLDILNQRTFEGLMAYEEKELAFTITGKITFQRKSDFERGNSIDGGNRFEFEQWHESLRQANGFQE
jgi:zinc protease